MPSKIVKTLERLSLGFILVLFWGWLWLRSDLLFPVNTNEWKFGYILTYMVFVALIFSFDTIRGAKTEKALFRVSFFKRFPVFLISATISLVILWVFGFFIKGGALNSVSQAISSIGIGVILLHAFMVAIFEELVFRGWVVDRLQEQRVRKNVIFILQAIIFAIFHAFMGKSFITLLLYIPLGMLFMIIKNKFSPRTNMANSGVHFAWNVFILGFLT